MGCTEVVLPCNFSTYKIPPVCYLMQSFWWGSTSESKGPGSWGFLGSLCVFLCVPIQSSLFLLSLLTPMLLGRWAGLAVGTDIWTEDTECMTRLFILLSPQGQWWYCQESGNIEDEWPGVLNPQWWPSAGLRHLAHQAVRAGASCPGLGKFFIYITVGEIHSGGGIVLLRVSL